MICRSLEYLLLWTLLSANSIKIIGNLTLDDNGFERKTESAAEATTNHKKKKQ